MEPANLPSTSMQQVGGSPAPTSIPSSSSLEDQIRAKFLSTLDDTRMPDPTDFDEEEPLITMVKAKGKAKVGGKLRKKSSKKHRPYSPIIAEDTNKDLIATILDDDITPEEDHNNCKCRYRKTGFE